MATVFRKTYTRMVGGRRVRKKTSKWYFRFRDADGNLQERVGLEDRELTERLLTEARAEAMKVQAGVLSPEEVELSGHATTDIGR